MLGRSTRGLLLLAALVLGCATAARQQPWVYVPQDPHAVGIPAPYQQFTEATKLEAAVAALGAAGLDVSAFASSAFTEGTSVAVFVGVPLLQEQADGSFAIQPTEPTWGWEDRSPIEQKQLAFGVADWSWSTDEIATLVVGPMTSSSTTLPCESDRRSGSPEPEGMYYERAPHEAGPRGYRFEVEPTLYVLPARDRVEVLYAVQRYHMIVHPTDCFMTDVATATGFGL